MVFIVAEIGSNHNSSLDEAKRLIKIAHYCGVDAVKFQVFQADSLYSKNTKDFDKYKNVHDMMKKLEVPLNFFKECYNICLDIGVEFMATPFSVSSANFLAELGVKRIKVASFEFSDARLIRHIAGLKLPIIASTGLSNEDNIFAFLSETAGRDVTLLHCNSAYPTPDEDAHLSAINYLKKFGTKVGYSDHTEGILAPVVAVGMGACVIEKHFTSNRKNVGPDHSFAIEPKELETMVYLIRQCEKMLGSEDLNLSNSESPMLYARRSVVAKRFIPQGKIIDELDITTKRPGTGIPAAYFFKVIGCMSKQDIEEDTILEDNHIRRKM